MGEANCPTSAITECSHAGSILIQNHCSNMFKQDLWKAPFSLMILYRMNLLKCQTNEHAIQCPASNHPCPTSNVQCPTSIQSRNIDLFNSPIQLLFSPPKGALQVDGSTGKAVDGNRHQPMESTPPAKTGGTSEQSGTRGKLVETVQYPPRYARGKLLLHLHQSRKAKDNFNMQLCIPVTSRIVE